MIDQNNLILEEISKKLEEAVHSALAAVPGSESNLTENIAIIMDEILATERTWESRKINQEDMLRITMEAIRPELKRMAFDERNQAFDEMAENFKKAGLYSCGRIAAGPAREQEPEDPHELGWRIMEKRNPHYKGQDQ